MHTHDSTGEAERWPLAGFTEELQKPFNPFTLVALTRHRIPFKWRGIDSLL
jgi:hypothetical protein